MQNSIQSSPTLAQTPYHPPATTPRLYRYAFRSAHRTDGFQWSPHKIVWIVLSILIFIGFVKVRLVMELGDPSGLSNDPGLIAALILGPVVLFGGLLYMLASSETIAGRLCRYERRVAERGTLTSGKIVERAWPFVTVAFEDLDGEVHNVRYRLRIPELYKVVKTGEEVGVLFDADRPSHALVPYLVGVRFEERPSLDHRPNAVENAGALTPGEAFACRPRHSRARGTLQIDGERLLWSLGGAHGEHDLNSPFGLNVYVWPKEKDRADAALSIVVDGRRRLTVCTEVDQALVSASVQTKRVEAGYQVGADEFLELWHRLQWYAELHSEVSRHVLGGGRSLSAPRRAA